MSLIRNGLLALTTMQPVYALQLHAELTKRGGRKLNSGQVYTTLARAQRDGLLQVVGTTPDKLALFAITPKGRELVTAWFLKPETELSALSFQISIALSLPESSGFNKQFIQQLLNRAIAQTTARLQAITAQDTPQAAVTDPLTALETLHKKAQAASLEAALSWLAQAQHLNGKTAVALNPVRPKKGRTAKTARATVTGNKTQS